MGALSIAYRIRHSRRTCYRHSRVSGNPERYWKDQPVAVPPPPDSRLRGNDGRGGRRIPAYAGMTVGVCPVYAIARQLPAIIRRISGFA